MTLLDNARAAEIIEQITNCAFSVDMRSPATKAQVEKLEEVISLQLPESYREFLGHYGILQVWDDYIGGIWDDDFESTAYGCMHADTLRARRDAGLDHKYAVLEIQDDEYYVCLDTSQIRAGDCPVVGIDRPPMKGRRQMAATFAEYFISFLERCLKIAEEIKGSAAEQAQRREIIEQLARVKRERDRAK